MKKQLGAIGHSAHLGGAMGGFLITLLLHPSLFITNNMLVTLLGIPILLLFIFGDRLKNN